MVQCNTLLRRNSSLPLSLLLSHPSRFQVHLKVRVSMLSRHSWMDSHVKKRNFRRILTRLPNIDISWSNATFYNKKLGLFTFVFPREEWILKFFFSKIFIILLNFCKCICNCIININYMQMFSLSLHLFHVRKLMYTVYSEWKMSQDFLYLLSTW